MNHLLAYLVKSGVRVSPLGLVEMTCPAIILETVTIFPSA